MDICLDTPQTSTTSDTSDAESEDLIPMSDSPVIPLPGLPFPKRVCTDNIALSPSISANITENEARMAVALTEYFQEQCKVYEQVSLDVCGPGFTCT